MNRSLAAIVAAVAVVAAGQAAEAKRPAPASPLQRVTYYLHGNSQIGEQDQTILTGSPLTMNATAPTGSSDKGKILENYVVGPNPSCTENGAFGVWEGAMNGGTLVGTVNVTFFTQNSPASAVDVRIFVDGASGQCDAATSKAYQAAVAEKDGVALPGTGGKVSVAIPVTAVGKAAIAHGNVVLEISPTVLTAGRLTPAVQRVLYDSTTSLSSVSFSCKPKAGRKIC